MWSIIKATGNSKNRFSGSYWQFLNDFPFSVCCKQDGYDYFSKYRIECWSFSVMSNLRFDSTEQRRKKYDCILTWRHFLYLCMYFRTWFRIDIFACYCQRIHVFREEKGCRNGYRCLWFGFRNCCLFPFDSSVSYR